MYHHRYQENGVPAAGLQGVDLVAAGDTVKIRMSAEAKFIQLLNAGRVIAPGYCIKAACLRGDFAGKYEAENCNFDEALHASCNLRGLVWA